MFIGHFAAGFAAKAVAPKVNLGWLVTAGTLVDLLFTVFLLLGVEHARIVPGLTAANAMDLYDFPWSHSLALDLGWSLLAAGLWWLWRRSAREATVIGLVVMSHWVLDVVSHIPDMALWPGSSELLGVGLWRSIAATVAVEGTLWVVALIVYTRATRPRDRIGRWGFFVYVALMSSMYASSFNGTPPPDMRVVAIVNLSLAIFLVWAAWFDRHRERRPADSHGA
jgi:hypothetical protein